MKASIFLHKIGRGEVLGSLLPVLEARGVACEFIDCFDGGLDAGFDALSPDILIVTGGSPGAYQTEAFPFLRQEIDVLEKRLSADLPTLGICLGAQLMAATLGARNYKGAHGVERGWQDILVNAEGMKTPLRHFDRSVTRMAQWHQDTFDLPAGATLLASSAMYENQAFSWGENGLAVQFHPETTPRLMRNWIAGLADAARDGKADPDEWRAQTEKYGPGLVRQAEIFMNEWLDNATAEKIRRQA